MSTLNGLPAHVLLVHFVVVLAPLAAGLALLCAVWPAARERFVWLVLALSAVVLVLTPFTTEAGEWLEHRVGESEALEAHEHLGETMLYVAMALLVAAVLLAVLHKRTLQKVASTVIAAVIVVLSVLTVVQVVRIGESGARAAWGDIAQSSAPPN